MKPLEKDFIKEILGEIPLSAELYWVLRRPMHGLKTRYRLDELEKRLPKMVEEAAAAAPSMPAGRKVVIFTMLHHWVPHTTVLGIALAGLGYDVHQAYLPHGEWDKTINRFDLRRQDLYTHQVLQPTDRVMKNVSLLQVRPAALPLPAEVIAAVQQVTDFDTQYTLQVEEADPGEEIYKIRHQRNLAVARLMLPYLQTTRPDTVIIPNGTILEFGVVYQVARFLKIDVVTYEFDEQRDRTWLAQNAETMRQDTDDLWQARKDLPFTAEQFDRIKAQYQARQHGVKWENFERLWQGAPSQGGEKIRMQIGLDNRPLVLLATNVLGDSVTLGRQVFSKSMSDWIQQTVLYFAGRPDVQLVVRVHPGEQLTYGPSMVDVIHAVLPELPENIHVIGPREKVNSYDIIEIAAMGLAYTTTIGMEMAMNGLPVIVAGQVHYRNRGFTYDPATWAEYYKMLGKILLDPNAHRLAREQVERAWMYAYRFFFEFPRPYPWHLDRLWLDYDRMPMGQVLSPKGRSQYESTFRYLAGEPLDWATIE
jgi:hypothetical protein